MPKIFQTKQGQPRHLVFLGGVVRLTQAVNIHPKLRHFHKKSHRRMLVYSFVCQAVAVGKLGGSWIVVTFSPKKCKSMVSVILGTY